jgi:bifunctional non-homologous end joining protein LigD
VDEVPEISTVTRQVQSRAGKVYVDFGQNGHGIKIATVYCVRPLPGAPASCPLRWDEVTARLDPSAFTLRTVPERFRSMPDPLTGVLGEGVDMAATLERIARRMSRGAEPGSGGRSVARPDRGREPARAKRAPRKAAS